MSGVGAWANGYYHKDMAVPNVRVAHGILAFKRELIYLGVPGAESVDASVLKFGKAMDAAVRSFQNFDDVAVDGVIGPTTAKHLWRPRGHAVQAIYSIPDDLVLKMLGQESNDDPVAEGELDNEDEGLAMIHLPFNPGVTIYQAWDPAFAVEFMGRKLRGGANYTGSVKGGVAAYNAGSWPAKLWVAAGYPSSGGPNIGTKEKPIDAFARCTDYWNKVSARGA